MLGYNFFIQTLHGVVGRLMMRAAHSTPGGVQGHGAVRHVQFASKVELRFFFVAQCPTASVAVLPVFVVFSVTHLPNKSLAEETNFPYAALAVAHITLACWSIVSRTRETAEFLVMWDCDAYAFKCRPNELVTLLKKSPLFLRVRNGDYSQVPSSLEQCLLKKRSGTCIYSNCSSIETPGCYSDSQRINSAF